MLRKILLIADSLGLDIVDSSKSNFVEKDERKKRENPVMRYREKVIIYTGLEKKE